MGLQVYMCFTKVMSFFIFPEVGFCHRLRFKVLLNILIEKEDHTQGLVMAYHSLDLW